MKLLIGYDGSGPATTALHDLTNAGLPDSGEAILLGLADFVLLPYPPDAPFNAPEQSAFLAHHEAEARRDALLVEAQNAALLLKENLPGWTIRAEADIGAPAEGLLKKAEEWKPDLLCIGAPHHSRLERLFFGSICDRIVRHSICSVRIGRTESAGRPLRLLLAMDASKDAQAAAAALLGRTWPRDTEVLVMSVEDSRLTRLAGSVVSAVYHEPVPQMLETLVSRLNSAGLKASSSIVDGVPKNELLAAAAQWPAHCIFMGASGTGALERLIMGSVSSALAAGAPCSVEVIRRPHVPAAD